MYVSIDMKNLRVLHAHQIPGIVHDLVYLECADLDYVVVQDTSSDLFLDQCTDMELKKLYLNLTEGSAALWDALAIRHALATLLTGVPATKVNHTELEAQCECAEKYRAAEDRTILRYAFGANVPAQVQELFPLKVQPMPASHDSTQRGTQRVHTPPVPVPHDPAKPAPVRPTTAPRAQSGSTRPRIFKVADEMWEAAGKPMGKDTVLALRKEMMVVLEEQHDIKKTTSSTALGDWMKQRVK